MFRIYLHKDQAKIKMFKETCDQFKSFIYFHSIFISEIQYFLKFYILLSIKFFFSRSSIYKQKFNLILLLTLQKVLHLFHETL